ncbi:MAG: hypothetical protein J6P28_04785, partial [Treponema sp.]|nr:hypothetical protein [Treponema sp.]
VLLSRPSMGFLMQIKKELNRVICKQFVSFKNESPQKKEKSGLDRWDAGKKQGVGTAKKKSVHGFFLDCRIATKFCMLLSRHPWLYIVWQERKAFLVFFTQM